MTDSGLQAKSALDPKALREDFPILRHPQPNGKRLIYLDNGATSQKPACVIDRQREVDETFYANAYRGVYRIGALVDEQLEASREAVRSFINARESAEIAFTSGTTMSINIVATGWGRKFLKPGDEIVLSIVEHHANLVPWQNVAEQTGAVIRYVPLTADYELDMEAYHDLLSERTRLVAVTGMSNVLGTLPDLKAMLSAAKEVGAVTLVDGAQLITQDAVDVQSPEVDFFVFSGHKIHAPSGVGVLYGRRERLEEMDPALFGGHMIAEVHRDSVKYADIPAKFEAGTLPITQAIALGTAIEYVQAIGMPAIHRYKSELLSDLDQKLRTIPGMNIYGPPADKRGAVASFVVDGIHAQDLAVLLDTRGICVRHGHHCTMPLHDELGLTATTRASVTFYNTTEDVDALVEGIEYARKRLRIS